MDSYLVLALVALVAALIGIFIGKVIFSKNTEEKIQKAEEEAARIKEDAKERADKINKEAEQAADNLKRKKLLEVKEQFLQEKADHDKEILQKNQRINDVENRLRKKEQSLNDRIKAAEKQANDNESLKGTLEKQLEIVQIRREELEKHKEENVRRLEKVANLSAEEAKNELMEAMKEEARSTALGDIKEIVEEAKITGNREAKKIIIQSIQRVAAEQTIENAITVFNLESDEVKGQIIGREGRNIRAIEAATGVDLIIDDTPEAVVLSCFDPLRREIARLSLQRLVQDGRIHPARIEEVVEKTKQQIEGVTPSKQSSSG